MILDEKTHHAKNVEEIAGDEAHADFIEQSEGDFIRFGKQLGDRAVGILERFNVEFLQRNRIALRTLPISRIPETLSLCTKCR